MYLPQSIISQVQDTSRALAKKHPRTYAYVERIIAYFFATVAAVFAFVGINLDKYIKTQEASKNVETKQKHSEARKEPIEKSDESRSEETVEKRETKATGFVETFNNAYIRPLLQKVGRVLLHVSAFLFGLKNRLNNTTIQRLRLQGRESIAIFKQRLIATINDLKRLRVIAKDKLLHLIDLALQRIIAKIVVVTRKPRQYVAAAACRLDAWILDVQDKHGERIAKYLKPLAQLWTKARVAFAYAVAIVRLIEARKIRSFHDVSELIFDINELLRRGSVSAPAKPKKTEERVIIEEVEDDSSVRGISITAQQEDEDVDYAQQ